MMRNIKAEMRREQITEAEVAALLGCCERTVYNKLTGVTDFTFDEAKKLRRALFPGMELEYLFEFTERPRAWDKPRRA